MIQVITQAATEATKAAVIAVNEAGGPTKSRGSTVSTEKN